MLKGNERITSNSWIGLQKCLFVSNSFIEIEKKLKWAGEGKKRCFHSVVSSFCIPTEKDTKPDDNNSEKKINKCIFCDEKTQKQSDDVVELRIKEETNICMQQHNKNGLKIVNSSSKKRKTRRLVSNGDELMLRSQYPTPVNADCLYVHLILNVKIKIQPNEKKTNTIRIEKKENHTWNRIR